MRFQSYSSFEEMSDAMSTAEGEANDRVTDQQRRIGPGDCWMNPVEPGLFVFGRVQRPWELVRSELLGITKYGSDHATLSEGKRQAKRIIEALGDRNWFSKMVTQDNFDTVAFSRQFATALRQTRPALDWAHDGESVAAAVEEFAYTLEVTRDTWMRGYRYGVAYSTVVPDGEYGSTHISQMIPLRLKEFVDAEMAGWDFGRMAHPASDLSVQWARDMVLSGATIWSLTRREVR